MKLAPQISSGRRQMAFRTREHGMLSSDLIVAMAILVVAVMPLALTFAQEGKVMRQSYQKAAAMELIDGEMEILLAGEWRAFHEGAQNYTLRGAAAKNLPPGHAMLTINARKIRLEWLPEKGNATTKVAREALLK